MINFWNRCFIRLEFCCGVVVVVGICIFCVFLRLVFVFLVSWVLI